MSETLLANDPAARTETGEIKDVSLTATTETTTPVEPAPAEVEAKPPPEGAPEAYTAFTVPEGYDLDAKVSAEAGAIFKELGLPQAAAQKLVDFYTKQATDAFEQPFQKYQEIRTGWRKEVTADPLLGNGQDLRPEVKATLGRAIDAMGAKESAAFREALDLTGGGDHPAVIRGLYALAQLVSEGRPVKGNGPVAPTAKPTTGAKAMYPNLS